MSRPATCASSKQYLVEFQATAYDRWLPPRADSLIRPFGLKLEVDGNPLGELREGRSVPYFLCEGNHHAVVSLCFEDETKESHNVFFVVSRPSVFELRRSDVMWSDAKVCEFDFPCDERIDFKLSPYEPEDQKAQARPAKPETD